MVKKLYLQILKVYRRRENDEEKSIADNISIVKCYAE